MAQGPSRVLKLRKFSKGRKCYIFSDRSGMPIKYSRAVIEPGTGLVVDVDESDGKWNRVDMNIIDPVPGDAQRLEIQRPGVLASSEYFTT